MIIDGAWKINFPERSGAPADVVLDSLTSGQAMLMQE